LILIGVALVADGFQIHIPRGSIYFAMAFAGVVETINIWAKGSVSRRSPASSASRDTFEIEAEPQSPPALRAPPTKGAPRFHPAQRMKAQRRRSRKK
jgi:hypothetical protein